MIYELDDLLEKPGFIKKLDTVYESDVLFINGEEIPILEKKPLELTLQNNGGNQLLITGSTDFLVSIPCGRCLEDVSTAIEIEICQEIPLQDKAIAIEDEISFIEENSLDINNLIFDELLVNWPSKVLCNDDCKGLCSNCGQNLNQQECGCNRESLDPRMAKFLDVFEGFKEV